MIWGLSPVDLAALLYFLVAWLGFAPFLRWKGTRMKAVAAAMIEHRRAWMHSLLGREMKVHDTQIMGHIMSTASFFASTTVIVMGALLGILVNMERALPAAGGAWYQFASRQPLEVKLSLILIVAVYAFLSFTWCIRQANYAAVMIGAAPPPPVPPELRERLSVSMADIITHVAASYDQGMRAYYFAIGAVTCIVSPILFILATTGLVVLLLTRQTRAATANALQEIAEARKASVAAAPQK